MKKVTYHTEEEGRSLEFDVLGVNKDGTVNIGLAEDPQNPGKPLLVVGSCKVTESPEPGACVAIADSVATDSLASQTKKELAENAEMLGIDTTGMNKAEIISSITKKMAEEE